MKHLETGKHGENLAALWLQERGFTILHKNWRCKNWEVDIIASKQDVLHFIEVKTRSSTRYGYPEEGVTSKKLENLLCAAEEYQLIDTKWSRIQFDIVSIILKRGSAPEYQLFSDIS